jgi:hypothetical protein
MNAGYISPALTSGTNNTLIGYEATASSATVSNEITLGNSSITRFRIPGLGIDWTSAPAALTGQTDSASPFETSLGVGAGGGNTGVNNTFVGYQAGAANTSANNSAMVGYRAGYSVSTGGGHSILGWQAGLDRG